MTKTNDEPTSEEEDYFIAPDGMLEAMDAAVAEYEARHKAALDEDRRARQRVRE